MVGSEKRKRKDSALILIKDIEDPGLESSTILAGKGLLSRNQLQCMQYDGVVGECSINHHHRCNT